MPLSALNHYLYCSRRAALIHVEGIFEENEHTIRGNIAHEHADLPGYEVARGVTVLRALPVWLERLGLSGKCDIVEAGLDANPKSEIRNPKWLRPVEYKKGKRRQFGNDDAQLCAQALCLEEMFGVAENAIAELHRLLETQCVPQAVFKPACEECSLFDICLPRATGKTTIASRLARHLFQI